MRIYRQSVTGTNASENARFSLGHADQIHTRRAAGSFISSTTVGMFAMLLAGIIDVMSMPKLAISVKLGALQATTG